MGGPGAGKGTQARLLEQRLGIPQISSGDLFRENFKMLTELGKQAKRYTDAGELVPDELTVQMVKERLTRPDCSQGALLDGFPRTIPQAIALDNMLAETGENVDVVPYIHVSPEVMLQRLAGRWTCKKCGHVYHSLFSPPKVEGICDTDGSQLYQREDDTEETQRRRIDVYHRQTEPLLAYYRQQQKLVEIDGEQGIQEVQEDLVAAIRAAQTAD